MKVSLDHYFQDMEKNHVPKTTNQIQNEWDVWKTMNIDDIIIHGLPYGMKYNLCFFLNIYVAKKHYITIRYTI
jgi:hypothetical protein